MADEDLVRRLVADADEVYHLAAAVGVQLIAQQPDPHHRNQHLPHGTLAAPVGPPGGRRADTVKFFMTSTSEVYGKNPKPRWTEEDDLVFGPTTRPRWSYGASKAIDEFLALAYWRERKPAGRDRPAVQRGRPAPDRRLRHGAAAVRRRGLGGRALVVHDDGQQQRCFAHVSDVVRMILALMDCPAAVGGVFNIGSDQPVSILDLARRVVAARRSVAGHRVHQLRPGVRRGF